VDRTSIGWLLYLRSKVKPSKDEKAHAVFTVFHNDRTAA